MMLDVTQEARLLARTLALRSARRVVTNLVEDEEAELAALHRDQATMPWGSFQGLHAQKRKVERLRRVLYQIDEALK